MILHRMIVPGIMAVGAVYCLVALVRFYLDVIVGAL